MIADPSTAAQAPLAERHCEAILKAARHCFARRGFQSTSMAEIARASGISVGHIYNFFSGKAELVIAIVNADMELFYGMVQRVENSSDKVRTYIESLDELLAFLGNPEEAALCVEILATSVRDAKVRAVVCQSDETVRSSLQKIFANGRSPQELPGAFDVYVDMYMGTMRSILFRQLSNPGGNYAARFREHLRTWALMLFGEVKTLSMH